MTGRCEIPLTIILSSNLCRCAGYENIIKAVRVVAEDMKARE